MTAKDYMTSVWRFLFEKNNQTPKETLPIRPVDIAYFNATHKDRLNSTWLGHSSLMINLGGYRLLTDPVFEKKVSPVGPARFNGDLPFDPLQLSQVDMVIISHDHYDHLNKASILLLAPLTQRFIVPLAVGKRLLSWGVPADKIIELDWWETFRFDAHLAITATPSQHFSGRGLGDRNKTLWASYVISSSDFNIFYSGDSGYFDGFKEIGIKFGPFDVTFLECGAYNDLWRPVHMFPEETVRAHGDLKGSILHPIHWGTFNLSQHAWNDPMQRLVTAAALSRIKVATPMAGQTLEYDTGDIGARWWEKISEPQQSHAF